MFGFTSILNEYKHTINIFIWRKFQLILIRMPLSLQYYELPHWTNDMNVIKKGSYKENLPTNINQKVVSVHEGSLTTTPD